MDVRARNQSFDAIGAFDAFHCKHSGMSVCVCVCALSL